MENNYLMAITAPTPFKNSKKVAKILIISITALLFLLGTMVAFLQCESVQNYLAHTATDYFSTKLGTKVQIGSVDIELFNKVSLKQVYIADQKGDTLIYADKIKMIFKPFQLIRNRFVCNGLNIQGLRGRLVIDKKKVFNLTFLLNAFKSKDTTKSKITYRIENVRLRNSRISFDNENFPYKGNQFDDKHVFVTKLNADISLHKLNSQYLIADLEDISLHEKSGFTLKNFTTSITADSKKALIEKTKIELPNSKITFSPITITYGSFDKLKKNLGKVHLRFTLNPSKIHLADLKAFVPVFKGTRGDVLASTDFQGSFSNLKIKNLNLSYSNLLSMQGDFELSGLPDLKETLVYAKIKDVKTDNGKLQDFLSQLQGKPVILPEQFNKLGAIHYKGSISGFFNNLVIYGALRTNMGLLSTDILLEVLPSFEGLNYSGSIHAQNLKTALLLNDKSSLDNLSFNLSSKGSILPSGEVKGDVSGLISSMMYKNYNYKNITLKGNFDKKGFEGKVNLDDPNAKLDFNGMIDFTKKMPSGNFQLSVKQLNPNKLNLTKAYPDLSLAFNISTDFSGESMEKTNTNVFIDSLYLFNKDKEVFIKKIYVKSILNDTASTLSINSDLVTGIVKGRYSFANLVDNVSSMLNNYLPSLEKGNGSVKIHPINNFVFHFSKFNIDKLADLLNIHVTLDAETSISGYYNDKTQKFRVEVISPLVTWGKNSYSNLNLLCVNPTDAINLTTTSNVNQNTKLNFSSRIANDSVLLNLGWADKTNFAGDVNVLTMFSRNDENKLQAQVQIQPSKVIMKDSTWNIQKSLITTDFKSINVSNFAVEHQNQFIKIHGIASSRQTDSLFVNLQSVQLNYVLDLLKVREPKMEAMVSGNCVATNVLDHITLLLDVSGKDFSFNNSLWGDVKLKSSWDELHKRIVAKGVVYTSTDTIAHLDGDYYSKKDSMNFMADAKALKADFLRYYLDSTLQNISGVATGKVRIFGSLKHILFDGDVAVRDGKFDIDYLKTSFHFADTVHLRPSEISFNNVKVFDKENHTAIFSGKLTHNSFKNMRFNFNVTCKNMLAMNTTQKDNPSFYGKAYATGRVRIQGETGKVVLTVDAKTEPHTKVYIPMQRSAVATENTFVQYVSNRNQKSAGKVDSQKQVAVRVPKSSFRVNLQIEATPDAEVIMATDQLGGDMIKASGTGNIRIDYDRNSDLKLYGNYEVEKGEYIFTLQQVIRKTFAIRQGGTIRWSGNPYLAIINLNAVYTVPSVSLLDILDESQLEGVARTSVPVNCLLGLTGDLMQPTIKFDLELPSDAELQRRIKNIVNTEEMMNREMLALLVMSRFYKPDYLQTSKTGVGTEMVSVLTTTVSGQLNSWLSQLGNKINVGVNARLGNGQDLSNGGEYEVAVMYQPNNRLVINSNLGYRNDVLNMTNSNFVGDVDLEYKLNKSGKLRAKAYTHSADNYYYTTGTAKTTQGVGLLYREDFNTFSELLRHYFSPKTKKNDTTKIEKDSVILKKQKL
ncbi:MAG: translocation/assembly module TamB domain-containing protein [Paludibacteraceae bacterium]|nr:translocation/assembly module TamB domain-containing protein [Paludibacteraceae bacterium]